MGKPTPPFAKHWRYLIFIKPATIVSVIVLFTKPFGAC